MSAITTTPSTPSAKTAPAPAPVRHRFWIPLSILAFALVAFTVPLVLEELEKWPEHIQNIAMMVEMFGILGVGSLLLLWWLFLSGFRWRVRLAVVAVLAMMVGGFIYSLRELPEWVPVGNLYLVPKFKFKWVQTPDDSRKAYVNSGTGPAIDLTIRAADSPCYFGRDGDGQAHGPALAMSWKDTEPRIVYKRPCVCGYSGFAVAGNVAITMEQWQEKADDPKETVVCYDRDTGRQLWSYDRLGAWKDKMMGDGPRATPAIDDKGRVFAVGATGVLVCLEGTTGKELWKINILDDAEAKNLVWGLSASPLLIDDVVVVNPGIDPAKPAGKAVCAYQRATGQRVWAAGNHPAGYSSPRLVTLCGERQILLFDGDGLAGLDPKTGKELWRHIWTTFSGMNNIQPVVYGGDRVFISSELANGSAMVRVKKGKDGWSTEEVWKSRSWAKFSNPVLVRSGLFVLSGGNLDCLDPETGKLVWRERGRFGQGQLLAAGDQLIVQTDDGQILLVAAEVAYKELGRRRILERKLGNGTPKTWNTPTLAGRQLFLRDNEKEMACVELPLR